MSSKKVQIDELRLRTSGLTREQARSLGENVARQLAENIPSSRRSRKLPGISIRINQGANHSQDGLAETIADQIRRRLG